MNARLSPLARLDRNLESQAKIAPSLRNRLKNRSAAKTTVMMLPVIVQFAGRLNSDVLRQFHKELGALKFRTRRSLPLINALAAKVTPACLKRICACSGVQTVYLDRIRTTNLNIATPSIGAAAVMKKRHLDGRGIRIAILDTGVYRHPDLIRPANRIAAFKDFVNGRTRPYDDNGHGTHIAGDAAGNGWSSKGKYKGPAPRAEIVAVKVFDQYGEGYDSTIIKGIEWCIANRKRLGIRILSLSFGGPPAVRCEEDPLCQAVEKAVRAGLVAVASAGNSGPARGTIESPGTSPSAITVGAADDRRTLRQSDDQIPFYSSRGPAPGGRRKPDLVAPGETISLRAPGSTLDRDASYLRVGRRYFVLSGTSISAPLVAGVAAQLLQARPGLTPFQVKRKLIRHAYRLGLAPNIAGSGEVNARFMLSLPQKKPACRSKA